MFRKNRFSDHPDSSTDPRRYMTIGDKTLLAAVVLIGAALMVVLPRWVLSGGAEVDVVSEDRLLGSYPLADERLIEVPGRLGLTVVRIKGGRACIESSPCPHKTCTKMGDVGPEGGVVVCIPNEVVVRTTKPRDDGIDAVTR
ncbi:MAG: NusG domain II-containing protein [Desulfomonile tiedjei]|nr:NusG domain II-containing protein [Desulfomonile tiedjei]